MNFIYFENGLLFDFAQSDNVPIETNTCYWNKFQILKIYRSYGTPFQNLHFFYKPFASTKQFLKINIDFLKKQPLPFSNSPTLPFSNSTILQFSHSQTLPFSNSPTQNQCASSQFLPTPTSTNKGTSVL